MHRDVFDFCALQSGFLYTHLTRAENLARTPCLRWRHTDLRWDRRIEGEGGTWDRGGDGDRRGPGCGGNIRCARDVRLCYCSRCSHEEETKKSEHDGAGGSMN